MGAGIYSVFRHCARSKKVAQNLPNHRGIAEASHGGNFLTVCVTPSGWNFNDGAWSIENLHEKINKAQHLSQENVCLFVFFTISTLFLTRQFVKLP